MQWVRFSFFFFQAEDGIRDVAVTGVQTCALPIYDASAGEVGGFASLRPSKVNRWLCLILATPKLSVRQQRFNSNMEERNPNESWSGRDLRAGRNGHPHESACGVRLEFQQTANLIGS